jgi:two-component system, cell cycle sensor histidine kinase and response regulator CckA
MNSESIRYSEKLPAEKLDVLYKKQLIGAFVRSGSSIAMWAIALLSFFIGAHKFYNFIGISVSVLYLIVINFPILLVFKHITAKRSYAYFSVFTYQLEITGYTAIIYFCGGIEATYITLIYAALIAYVGVVAPRRHSFIVASLCAGTYSLMLGLVYIDFLPYLSVLFDFTPKLADQLLILAATLSLLYIIAFISATSANKIKIHKDNLHHQNIKLEVTNKKLTQEIEERERIGDTLRESEEKYRTILESIEEGYYEANIRGDLTFINDSMCKILWYSKDELIGLNNRQFTDKETAQKVYEVYNKVYNTTKPIRGFEFEIIRKDGSKRHVECSVSLMKGLNDHPIGFRGIVRDVTERKFAEKEKERLEAQLKQAQKMEAIGTLAGGVAHDLNNFLSGIISYPELLLMDLPQDSALREPILGIKKSGEKASAVVQDLLTLARRGMGITKVENLNDIIDEYFKSPEHKKLKSDCPGVQFEINLEPGLLNIIGSSVHLSKTIMNLVSNATEAMPRGGTVSISTENRYIDTPMGQYDNVKEGDYVVATISDTGVGIASKDIGRIFEPFYSKKVMGRSGTGLGMAVVWGTVKDHNGYIDIQSSEGKWTTLILYFPATRKKLAKDETLIPIEDYMGNGESILIVDDVEEQRDIASKILKKLGYLVTAASSGEEAFEYMKNNSVDLLVLDMIMDPGIDGLETYKKILKLHPGQKAIITSGFSETQRLKETQKLGAGQYIKKPYFLENLGLAVKAEIEK